MKQIWKWTLVVGICIVGVWYFAIKQEHYQISFTTKQPSPIVYQHITDWPTFAEKPIDSISITAKEPFSELVQQIFIGDSLFLYRWNFSKNENGQTLVTAHIKDENNGLTQKLQTPFFKNDFVQRNIKNVSLLGNALAIKSKEFKVHSIKDTVFGSNFCAYLPIESTLKRKAATMLYHIGDLMGYINENELKLAGDPYLEVTQWDPKGDLIQYNFCFPITKNDSLPNTDKVLFKETPSFKALKATYNGNYKNSHNAWYYLLEYAQHKGLKIKNLPLEVFLNDPHTGGDAINWKADIFLPLEDKLLDKNI